MFSKKAHVSLEGAEDVGGPRKLKVGRTVFGAAVGAFSSTGLLVSSDSPGKVGASVTVSLDATLGLAVGSGVVRLPSAVIHTLSPASNSATASATASGVTQ